MMKGIEKLSLTAEGRKLLDTSEKNYSRFARVYFQVAEYRPESAELIVKVWQRDNPAGKYLTAAELVERARCVFKDAVPEGTAIHVRPIPFRKDELQGFTAADIRRGMEEFGLKPKDLVKMLDIDKSTISAMLNEGRGLTKPHRAMFYYLFKSLRQKMSV